MTRLSRGESSVFIGYEELESRSKIMGYRIKDGDESGGKLHVELIFDRTPFYATSGGQVADKGLVEMENMSFPVVDVFKRGGEIVHEIEVELDPEKAEELIRDSGTARLRIDSENRLDTARNHTATHLLHAALRKIVGEHVTQAGSLVESARFRFDFNHFQAISPETVKRVEEQVNLWIMEAVDVEALVMSYREAVDMGAMALFDEKYGKEVRVIRIDDISMELCGGTHIDNTGKIGSFFIVSEGSVAAGVRRIEGITGRGAVAYARSLMEREMQVAEMLKGSTEEIPSRVRSVLAEVDELRKKLKKAMSQDNVGLLDKMISSAEKVDGLMVASGRMQVDDLSVLRNHADIFRGKVARGIAVLSSEIKGKLQFVVAVTDDLASQGKVTADKIVSEMRNIVDGGGGGKKHLAQFGTKDLESEKKVFDGLKDIVKRLLEGGGS